MPKVRLAIFASGSGSNAENLYKYFHGHPGIEIALIASNNPNAFVLERARKLKVEELVFNRSDLQDQDAFIHTLEAHRIDGIVLAGFLLLVPEYLVQAFPDRILNIHPALLPAYGGKGMYGHHVHEAVISNGEKESGISIHLVNERYDDGNILAQYRCPILPADSPEDLASRIHELEYRYFPLEVERWVKSYFP